jgi:hypothetical protein
MIVKYIDGPERLGRNSVNALDNKLANDQRIDGISHVGRRGGVPEEDRPSLLFLREEDNTDNGSTVSGIIMIIEAPFQGNTDNDVLRNN